MAPYLPMAQVYFQHYDKVYQHIILLEMKVLKYDT